MKKQHLLTLTLMILLLLPTTSWATVTLKYFRAETPNANTVHLVWETATELDHAAFILSRAVAGSNQYQELGSFPAEGDAVSGATYEYDDTHVTQGQSYSYKLEDLNNDGHVSLAQQPITVSLSDAGTASGDATATQSATPPTIEPTLTQVVTAIASPSTTDAATGGSTPQANNEQANQNGTPEYKATPEAVASATETALPTAEHANHSASGVVTATPEKIANNAPVTFPTPAGAKQPPNTTQNTSNLLLYLGLAALAAAAVLGLVVLRIWRGQNS